MGIIKTGKIQSHGPDVGLSARVTALEEKYVKALWYAEISSGTSGTITPPANGTIVLNEWGNDVDAVTSTIVTGKKPDFVSVKTATGAIVTATLAANGAWTIFGTPSAYPIALVYVYEIKLINFDRAYSLYEEEFTQGLTPSDSPAFVGLSLSGLTQSLPVVTDASKALVSLAYTGATSLRKNLGLETTDTPTFGGIFVADGGTIGQAAGPLLTFNDTGNILAITGCNVGIGTTAPGAQVEIMSATGGTLRLKRDDTSVQNDDIIGTVEFYTNDGDGPHVVSYIRGLGADLPGQNYGRFGVLSFGVSQASTVDAVEVMRINLGGFVGINDTTPGEFLDVNGNINCTGVLKVDDVQVVGNRVVDARAADVANSGDTTTDGLIDALRDAMITHGLIASA